MTPEEIKADKRLRRTYGITLAEYNTRLEHQGGVCAICKRPPVKVRLAVDHDHRFDRIKIISRVEKHPTILPDGRKMAGYAECRDELSGFQCMYAYTRKYARNAVHLLLRRMSVRGLLCMSCNRGLQKFYDKPERFDAAAQYLRKFIPGNPFLPR